MSRTVLNAFLLQGTALAALITLGGHTAMAQSGCPSTAGSTGACQSNPSASAQLYGGGSTLATPTYEQLYGVNPDAGTGFNWVGLGSGAAQCALLSNTPAAFKNANSGGVSVAGPVVDFIASDAAFDTSQTALKNSIYSFYQGGSCNALSPTATIAANAPGFVYPAYAPGMSAPGNQPKSTSGRYTPLLSEMNLNGSGGLIQLPAFATPITIAVNNSLINGATRNGQVKLTDAAICGVASGAINTTTALASTSGVSGVKSGSPLKFVYRSDGSGTTFLFTNHLKAVCAAGTFPNQASAPLTTFSQLFNTVPGSLVGASGSPGVQNTIVNTNYALGYLSPDYTAIATTSVNPSGGGTAPFVASVANTAITGCNVATPAATCYALPNLTQTAAALSDPNFNPPTTSQTIQDPAQWNPLVPTPAAGYPIVGYTVLGFTQCYQSAAVGQGVVNYLANLYGNPNFQNVITSNGFVPVSSAFSSQISNYFLTGPTDPITDPANTIDFNDPNICRNGSSDLTLVLGRG